MMTLRFSLLGQPSSEDDDTGSSLFDCLTLKMMTTLIKSVLGLLDSEDGDNSFSLLVLFDPEGDAAS